MTDMRVFVIISMLLLMGGCTAMLVGADATPTEASDSDEDDESRSKR